MSERGKRLVAVSLVVLLVAGLASACAAPQGPASKPATKNIEKNTQSRNDSITAAIDQAQAKVSQLETAAAAADKAVPGLDASAKLQEIERTLTGASNQAGQAKIDAVRAASASMTDLIKKVDDAAAKAPAGSRKQQVLTNLSGKLQTAQLSLAAAVEGSPGSRPGSSEPTSGTP